LFLTIIKYEDIIAYFASAEDFMEGIKKHTHQEREQIVREMIPLIKKKFGKDLVALAAQASFARGDDFDYSDLELHAFLKKKPRDKKRGMSKIRDGVLVELTWSTEEDYIKNTKEVTKEWYLAGSDTLVPIINKPFIDKLNKYKVANLKEKCLCQALIHWHEVQEATAKVLNAIGQKNREHIPFLMLWMLDGMLISLSYINHTPYITAGKFIAQARSFKLKPERFDDLVKAINMGAYQDLSKLENIVTGVFESFEDIFNKLGCRLYDDNVDPSIPNGRP
jgi:hypothetical protein